MMGMGYHLQPHSHYSTTYLNTSASDKGTNIVRGRQHDISAHDRLGTQARRIFTENPDLHAPLRDANDDYGDMWRQMTDRP